MDNDPKPTRYQGICAEARLMLSLGESGRFEFKREPDVVSVKLLATLANWIALDPDRGVTHLLLGVDEVEDEVTGLVYGVPYGLPKGLDRTVARIQDPAGKTRPVPIDAFIVEENVATETPFVRVEIRPTVPPHFDDEGRRQTRQGRSTRALTDDELLRIYLDREAGSVAARFRQSGEELRSAVGAIGGQVDDIALAIENSIAEPIRSLASTAHAAADAAASAASSADSAEASAMNAEYETDNMRRLVEDLREVVEDIRDDTPEGLAFRLLKMRQRVLWGFAVDTFGHTSPLSNRLEERLHGLLSVDISIDMARSRWELGLWEDALAVRSSRPRQRGTQKWWHAKIREIESYVISPSYAPPHLPGLRAALRVDLDHELDDPQSVTREFLELIDE